MSNDARVINIDVARRLARRASNHTSLFAARSTASTVPSELSETYSRAQAARVLNVSLDRLRHWERSGLLRRSGSSGKRRFFTFGDLVDARHVRDLVAQGLRAHDVVDAVREPQAAGTLPPAVTQLRALSGVRRPIVQDGGTLYDPRSGQLLLRFGEVPAAFDPTLDATFTGQALGHAGSSERAKPALRQAAYGKYLEGCRLEADGTNLTAAESAYRDALKLDPSLACVLTNLGTLRYRQGHAHEAIELYARALNADPKQPEALYNLGVLLYDHGQVGQAAEYFGHAIAADPAFADAHFNLAMVLEELGCRRQARAHWEVYLELEPSGIWSDIARSYLREHGS